VAAKRRCGCGGHIYGRFVEASGDPARPNKYFCKLFRKID